MPSTLQSGLTKGSSGLGGRGTVIATAMTATTIIVFVIGVMMMMDMIDIVTIQVTNVVVVDVVAVVFGLLIRQRHCPTELITTGHDVEAKKIGDNINFIEIILTIPYQTIVRAGQSRRTKQNKTKKHSQKSC